MTVQFDDPRIKKVFYNIIAIAQQDIDLEVHVKGNKADDIFIIKVLNDLVDTAIQYKIKNCTGMGEPYYDGFLRTIFINFGITATQHSFGMRPWKTKKLSFEDVLFHEIGHAHRHLKRKTPFYDTKKLSDRAWHREEEAVVREYDARFGQKRDFYENTRFDSKNTCK